MKKSLRYFLPAIGWLIISTILLTLPGTAFPKDDWLGKIWFDKWVHIGMFGIMVVLWCYGWQSLRKNSMAQVLKRNFITIGIVALCYGTGMEFVQNYLIPHRSFDTGDIVADAVGCLLGVIFSTRRYIKKIDPCRNRGRNQN